jgi:type I restriction enzyme S subunit
MEKLQPTLRFPEFEGDWEDTSLEVIGEYIGGGTPKTGNQEYWQGEIPWISSSDIFENDIHNINVQKYITEDAVLNSATKKIPAGSLIIVSRVGVGKFAINSTEVCTSQDFTNIVIDKESYDPNFAAFNLYKNIEILFNISQGTSIKGFTITELKKTNLSFPSISEQTKIAPFLSSVDEKLNLLKEKKALLEEYKKGMMQQIFSQQLRFKDEDGKDFADWNEKSLGEICTLVTKGTTPKAFSSAGIRYIKTECFEDNRINIAKCLFIEENIHEKELKRSILRENDILFAIAGSIGKVNIVTKEILPANTNQALAIIRLKEVENHFFILQILKSDSMQKYITENVSVGAQPNLNLEQMNSFSFICPSSMEQTKIANFLSAIDEKIELVAQQIEDTQEYKIGLLQGMFC